MATFTDSGTFNTAPDNALLPPMDLHPLSTSTITFGPLGVARGIVRLFSTSANQRPPPSPTKTEHLRLITVEVSHYCEKARWALDLLDVDSKSPNYYTEDAHPPAFAAFETLQATNGLCSAAPVLLFRDGTYLSRSDDILRELCPFLYPVEIKSKVMKLEEDLGNRLGATLRCHAYHNLLSPKYYDLVAQIACVSCATIEKYVFAAMLDKGINVGMRKSMYITEESAAMSAATLRQVFHEYSELLKTTNGGVKEYLLDDDGGKSYGFTAADLTLAALSFPYIRPPSMVLFGVEQDDKLPPDILELANELKATLAGQHVLKLYERHRPTNSQRKDDGGALVSVKTAKRDRWPWQEMLILTVGLAIAVAMATKRAQNEISA